MAKKNQAEPAQLEPELNFEEAMNKLEEIVSHLERGEVPLEQAIELFQQGMQLSQMCGRKLSQVERKIEMIVEQDGEAVKVPFHSLEGEGDSLG